MQHAISKVFVALVVAVIGMSYLANDASAQSGHGLTGTITGTGEGATATIAADEAESDAHDQYALIKHSAELLGRQSVYLVRRSHRVGAGAVRLVF